MISFFEHRFATLRPLAVVLVGWALIVVPACSGASTTTETAVTATMCGNGAVDPGETCDTAIASGGEACPGSCDDHDACTTDTRSGSACTTACAHDAITACTNGDGCCASGCTATTDTDCVGRCGDGVVGPDETCDVAASGTGACPIACDDGDPCTKDEKTGAACTTRCTHQEIAVPRSGDRCCPKGVKHAVDSDCPAQFGEACTSDGECASGSCLGTYCSRTCNLNGGLATECGGRGFFCSGSPTDGTACVYVVDTGTDTDDKFIGLGIPAVASIESAADVDVFAIDVPAGEFKVILAPIDVGSTIDLAYDVYNPNGSKGFTVNDRGPGLSEDTGGFVFGSAARTFIAVRSANTIPGNYSITISKR